MPNGLKLKWQPFSQWSGAGSKAWTWFLERHPPRSTFVCGSGGENKELDCLQPKRRRRWGGRESVSCGLKEDDVCFHPLLSTCCSQKTFHPLSWPEAAFPLRPDRFCDLLQLLECLKLISRTHREIPAAKNTVLAFVLFYIYHTRFGTFLLRMYCFVLFFLVPPKSVMNDLLLLSVGAVFFGERGLKIVTLITWHYFRHFKVWIFKTRRWYAPADVLFLVYFPNPVFSACHFISKWTDFYCVFPVLFAGCVKQFFPGV